MPQLNIKVRVCLKIRESVKLQPDSAFWDNGKCPRNGKGSMRSGGAVEVMQLCTIGGWPKQWRRSGKTEGGEIDSERREGGGRGV